MEPIWKVLGTALVMKVESDNSLPVKKEDAEVSEVKTDVTNVKSD